MPPCYLSVQLKPLMTPKQYISTGLDIRTRKGAHLSAEQRVEVVVYLKKEYVSFYCDMKAHDRKRASPPLLTET